MTKLKIASALLAGTLSAYAGLSMAVELAGRHMPRQGQALEKTVQYAPVIDERQGQEPEIERGVVLSSNKDMGLAALAVNMMQQQGYDAAHLMEFSHKGQKFYRTVIPYADDKDISSIIEAAKETRYFQNAKDAFQINLLTGELLRDSIGQPSSTASGARPKVIAQDEIDGATRNITREQYSNMLYKKVQDVYESFWGKHLTPGEAKQIIEWVYDDSNKYSVPFLPTLAVALHESKANIYAVGDKKLGESGTAHGLLQIRKPSIGTVMNLMRAEKVAGVPKSGEEAVQNPRKLTELGIYHFAHCYNKVAGGSVRKAVECHNRGFNSNVERTTPYQGKVGYHLEELENIAKREQ